MSITYNFSKNETVLVLAKNGTYFALTVDNFLELQQIFSEVINGEGTHYANDLRTRPNETVQFNNEFVRRVRSQQQVGELINEGNVAFTVSDSSLG